MSRQNKKNSLQMKSKKPEGAAMTQEDQLETLQTEIDAARIELEKTKKELEDNRAEIEKFDRREHDKAEMEIVDGQIKKTIVGDALKQKMEQQRAYDKMTVTGKFINRRAPGQSVKLPYIKYADDPVKWYSFEDGKVYTIPRGFVDQINEYYHTPVFKQKVGEYLPSQVIGENSSIGEVDRSNKKYAFVPVQF